MFTIQSTEQYFYCDVTMDQACEYGEFLYGIHAQPAAHLDEVLDFGTKKKILQRL